MEGSVPLDENNPTIKLGADCVRQLIRQLERACVHPGSMAFTREWHDDTVMALCEAREWLGETEECEGGACRL